jgi:hypothetical protein
MTSMRRLAVIALLAGMAMTLSTAPAAAIDKDVRAAAYLDSDAFGFGAGLLSPIGSEGRWFFNPNLELALGDADRFAVNGDFHYDFGYDSGLSMWLGGGPAILVTDPDVGDSRTDLGLNLLTGIGGTRGSVRPFGQVRGVISEDSEVVLQGGIRF